MLTRIQLIKGLIFFIVVLHPFLVVYYFYLMSKDAIHIAVVGDLGSERSSLKALELSVEEINRKGGLLGKEIVLDLYDDRNEPEQAGKRALEIVADKKAVAVVGHDCDRCTIAGGDIYRKHGIPAISPTTLNNSAINGNDWYFRTVFNNRTQGEFLAHYIDNVFEPRSVFVVFENTDYGTDLTGHFEKAVDRIKIPIKNKWGFESDDPEQERLFQEIVDAIGRDKEESPIFLAMGIEKGSQLIRLLKDADIDGPVVAPHLFSLPTFPEYFKDYPKERIHPGYYTDGLYVVSPLLFELGNVKSQEFQEHYRKSTNREPHWKDAFAVDSMGVLLEAVRKSDLQGDRMSLEADRRKIRDFLVTLSTPTDAIEGVTGINYYDGEGNAVKPVAIGVYNRRKLVPALFQFQTIPAVKEIRTLEVDLEEGRIMKIGTTYYHKTSVIHTGIDILEISELEMDEHLFKLKFHLWFRYNQGEIDIGKIEFLNALKPIPLRLPVDEEIVDQTVYRRYLVDGVFKTDFLPSREYGKHVLGVAFRHKNMTRNELLYIKDELGIIDKSRNQLLKNSKILSSAYDWIIENITFFQDISKKATLGSIKYIRHKEKTVEHSRFTAKITIKKSHFSIRRSVPPGFADLLFFMVSALLVAVVSLRKDKPMGLILQILHPMKLRRQERVNAGFAYSQVESAGYDTVELEKKIIRKRRENAKTTLMTSSWFAQSILLFPVLLLGESFIVNGLLGRIDRYYIDTIIFVFDILWWIVPTRTVIQIFQRYIFDPIEMKTERKVPGLVRNTASFFFYLMMSFGIIAFVLDFKITGLLATSGVLMMIIGLAVQLNIANIFSGLAINIEHPYRVGDWVEIAGFDEGRVIDVNWRTTRLQDRNECVICIPNSTAAESMIYNFNMPTEKYRGLNVVYIDPEHEPAAVKKVLLDAVLAVDSGVLHQPMPTVSFAEMNDSSAKYNVFWWSDDFAKRFAYRQAVLLSIWSHLKLAGIRPGIQRQEVRFVEDRETKSLDIAVDTKAVIKNVDLFKGFSEEEREHMYERMNLHTHKPGDVVVKKGESGDSLFIIVDGTVKVEIELPNKEKLVVARLGVGKYFGEMALLTGESRTADVIAQTDCSLFEITKDDIAPILKKRPAVAETLSQVLSDRKSDTESKKGDFQSDGKTKESFFRKIKGFFKL